MKWDEARQQQLLLFPEGVLVLNATAQTVLALCDGINNFSDIVKKLNEQYKTDVASDVKDLLSRLIDKKLVVLQEPSVGISES